MQTGHVLVGFLSTVCVLFLAVALGDGRSVLLQDAGAATRAADNYTYGHGYGIGVWKDSNGNAWTDKLHPTELLGCDDHQERGQAVKAFSTIAIVASTLAVLVSLLGASEGGVYGKVNAGLQALMFVSFLLAMALGFDLVESEFNCNGGLKLTLKDHFSYNYGCFFLLTGTVVSLLNIALLVATGSLSGEPAAAAPATNATAEHEPTAEVLEKKSDVEQQ